MDARKDTGLTFIYHRKKFRIKKHKKRDLGGPGNLIKSHPMRSLATMSESGNPMYWQNELELFVWDKTRAGVTNPWGVPPRNNELPPAVSLKRVYKTTFLVPLKPLKCSTT